MKRNEDSFLKQKNTQTSMLQDNRHIFGMVQFYSWATQRQVDTILFNNYISGIVSKPTWSIEYGTYNAINGAFFFGIISKSNIERLGLCHNKRPNIIRQIKQASFPILTKLLLSGNHITSLQFLDHIDAPLLESIALMNNNLTHIKSIKKTNFMLLAFFGIQKNFINQFSIIAKTITKKLCHCLIQMAQNQNVQGHNLNWLLKIQCQNLEELWVQSSKRINQKMIKKQIKKRFNSLQIEDHYNFLQT